MKIQWCIDQPTNSQEKWIDCRLWLFSVADDSCLSNFFSLTCLFLILPTCGYSPVFLWWSFYRFICSRININSVQMLSRVIVCIDRSEAVISVLLMAVLWYQVLWMLWSFLFFFFWRSLPFMYLTHHRSSWWSNRSHGDGSWYPCSDLVSFPPCDDQSSRPLPSSHHWSNSKVSVVRHQPGQHHWSYPSSVPEDTSTNIL